MNNFLQWNPTEANQETDAAYAADSNRAGGQTVNSIVPSAMLNKIFFQVTTMVKAIADYMVAQGQNAVDSNEPVLSANFAAAIATQIAAIIATNVVSVAFSTTPTFDASQGKTFEMTLTGNVTTSALINLTPGNKITFIIHQDGTGSRTFNWPSNVFGAGVIDPGASNTSVQEFIVGADGSVRPVSVMTVS